MYLAFLTFFTMRTCTALVDRATVSGCSYVDMMEGALMNLPGDTNTSVTLLDNLVHGFVWCTNKVCAALSRPARAGDTARGKR